MTGKGRLVVFAVTAVAVIAIGVRWRGWLSDADTSSRPMGLPASGLARQMPEGLTVIAPSGEVRVLAPAPGKLLLVHFWATWCPPCVEELPGLLAYAKEIQSDPTVELLAVSVDDSYGIVNGWLNERQASDLPIALDPKREAATRFGTEKFPETYFVSPAGKILNHVKGPIDWSSKETRSLIGELKRKALASAG